MANEQRTDLISRKALIAEYDRVHIGPPGGARKLMEDAPGVDAVEVVRCCDCQNCTVFQQAPDSEVLLFCEKRKGHPMVDPTDFCSYGERKGDGNV